MLKLEPFLVLFCFVFLFPSPTFFLTRFETPGLATGSMSGAVFSIVQWKRAAVRPLYPRGKPQYSEPKRLCKKLGTCCTWYGFGDISWALSPRWVLISMHARSDYHAAYYYGGLHSVGPTAYIQTYRHVFRYFY